MYKLDEIDAKSLIGSDDTSTLTWSRTLSLASTLRLPDDAVLRRSTFDYRDLEKTDLESGSLLGHCPSQVLLPTQLPPKKGTRLYRCLRWTLLSTYRRIFSLVLVCNLGLLAAILATGDWMHVESLIKATTAAVSVNLCIAVVVRQEHFVNMLFYLSSGASKFAPLAMRRWLAKVYEYGGLHSGCGLSAMAWYAGVHALTYQYSMGPGFSSRAVPALTISTAILLLAMSVTAHPGIRSRLHNWFEVTHRFAGWAVVALFWAQTVMWNVELSKNSAQTVMRALMGDTSLWCLCIIIACIVYPWTRLRRVSVRVEGLSDHAVRLHFDHARAGYCTAVRLSDKPLTETHAFACIPAPNGAKGFSVVVSNAGDWTRRIINNPPTKLWTRGVPQCGVLRVATAFRPVVIVATGSGIGPCLGLFSGRPGLECRVLWSTPKPLETYGQEIVDEVRRADKKAVIWDTRKSGRPDMVALAYSLYKEAGAEAVVIISNPRVTRKVVYGLESRGVAAYGPIFDS